ncbi:hypothetical protein XELAEV_18020652mg [Xenopus laevis]|uniref:Uncharacterized protein n=1 Tax=Xenopus laevis TaxID=8355 RepID=A0A974D856_XENLA|nr:hypothetical protein XELAEV_18020652mg [Xenopus laevis]
MLPYCTTSTFSSSAGRLPVCPAGGRASRPYFVPSPLAALRLAHHIFLATLLGVAGGVYIYKPMFEQYAWEQKHPKQEASTIETVGKKSE